MLIDWERPNTFRAHLWAGEIFRSEGSLVHSKCAHSKKIAPLAATILRFGHGRQTKNERHVSRQAGRLATRRAQHLRTVHSPADYNHPGDDRNRALRIHRLLLASG